MAYQSLDGAKGSSNSPEKLIKLRLPDMRGRSFLDIGCNSGFFPQWALANGAAHTVGIDANPEVIAVARERDAVTRYIQGNWYDALESLDERFDVILHSSAFHYVTDQPRFLKLVHNLLTDGGVFVLEAGVIAAPLPRYEIVRRPKSYTRHLTRPLLNKLLEDFGVREYGQSVLQGGDPVPRYVFHCSKWRPTAILLAGDSFVGKSTLAGSLARGGDTAHVKLDEICRTLRTSKNPRLESVLSDHFARNPGGGGVSQVTNLLHRYGIVDDFAAAVPELLPTCFRTVVVEGEVLTDATVMRAVAKELVAAGFRIWEAQKAFALDDGDARPSDPGTLNLMAPTTADLMVQVAREKYFKARPAQRSVMVHAADPAAKKQTAIAWIVDAGEHQRFECHIRVGWRSRPVRFTVEALALPASAVRDAAHAMLARVGANGASALPPPAESNIAAAGAEEDTRAFSRHAVTLAEDDFVLAGSEAFTRVGINLPSPVASDGGDFAIRIVVRMADADDANSHSTCEILHPVLTKSTSA